MMEEPLLTLKNVCKYYTGNQSVVMGLNNVELSFRSGEFVAVTGESGSGKSTLAQVISGILPYESGELLMEGRPTSHYDSSDWERHRREKISFISQSYGILPGSTVLQNVVTALRITGMEESAAEEKAEQLLRLVELWVLRSRRAGKLSSGQKQRLSIARALAKPAPILVADEPTGNLDPENSAKVIELLARAAKERLVILITHDFQEAEQYATRRITLQDGRVAADAPLRSFEPAEKSPEIRRKRKNLSGFAAALQITGRPVWSALVLLFFALTAFGVFAFLGTFLVNLDDTSTRIYDDSAFVNGDPTRIVVQRSDLESLTEEDWGALLAVEHVEELERSGYVTDISYAWRQDVDYELHYRVENRGGDEDRYKVIDVSVEPIEEKMEFLKTVPLMADGTDFLREGRLPENMYEVVLAGAANRIGETFSVYIQDRKNWSVGSYVHIDVTVVGVTNRGSGLYFDEELGRVITDYSMAGGWENSAYLVAPVYGSATAMDADIFREINGSTTRWQEEFVEFYQDGEGEMFVRCYLPGNGFCTLSQDLFNRYKQYFAAYFDETDPPIPVHLPSLNGEDAFGEPEAIGYHDSTFVGYVQVTPEVFDRVAYRGNSNQVSLTIRDYAYTEQVLQALQDMGYIAVSPFQQGATEKNPTLAQQRIQTLGVCLAALAAVILLLTFLLRELFGIQTESYKLLADMGLGCAAARWSVLWQVLALALGGQLLGFGAIGLCGAMGIRRIVSILHYLPALNWLGLSAVHLAVSVLAGILAMNAMKRNVYPQSGDRGDLNLEEVAV